MPKPPDNRPDLQIESNHDLGNGSPAVCDTGPPPPAGNGGGVPGIDPPDFEPGPAPTPAFITNALNGFACRFEQFSPGAPCTFIDDSGGEKLVNPDATIQFCDAVTVTAAFPTQPPDTTLTVQLRDILGNLGPTAQIVVHYVTPTPAPPTPAQ